MSEPINTPITQPISQAPQGDYFGNPQSEYKMSFKEKLPKYWDAFQYRARQVWPWIYRLINFIVYEIIKVLKAIIRMGLAQFGLVKD